MRVMFVVQGEPHGKMRPRFTVRAGHTVAYKPKQDQQYEKQIQEAFREAANVCGWQCDSLPITLQVYAYQQIPKDVTQFNKYLMLNGEANVTRKPDLDNVIKMVDALNGLAWLDDKQIIRIVAQKKWCETNPRVEFVIRK